MFTLQTARVTYQKYRQKNVRRKLNAMALEFVDKVVLLVDGIFPPFYHTRARYLMFPPQIRLFGEQHLRKLYKWPKMSVRRRSSLQVVLPLFGMHFPSPNYTLADTAV